MTLGDRIRKCNDDELAGFMIELMARTSNLTLKCCGIKNSEIRKEWIKKSIIEKSHLIHNRISGEAIEETFEKYNKENSILERI